MRFLPGSGVELAAHELRSGRRPVLLAHASGFHGRVWAPLTRSLPDARCLAVDLRGHGASFLPDGAALDWDAHARDILASVDELGNGPWWGVGHSMGAAILLLAEQRRPGTFAGLWCYEPIVFPPDLAPPTDGSRNEMVATALRRRPTFPSFEDAYVNFAAKAPFDVLHPDALREYVDHGFASRPDGSVELRCRPEVEAVAYDLGARHRGFDHLGEVLCPTVIAAGGSDAGPADVAPALAERIPDGRLVEFPQLGHFGPLQDPRTIAESIDGFFRWADRPAI